MENVEDIYALSPLQAGILFHVISAPDSGVYHEQFTCCLTGELDVPLFEEAWQGVFDRHPALRTIFLWEDIDEPLQVVRRQVSPPWRHEDWCDATDQAARLDRFLRNDRGQGIDLTNAPLSRMFLARVNPTCWRFVWSFHHLMLDGWSTPLVVREALATYEDLRAGRKPSDEPSPLFRDYIAWLQGRDPILEESFWRERLAGFDHPNQLRFYDAIPDRTGHQRSRLELSAGLSAKLRLMSRERRLTLNTVLHGAWALLLHCSTGDDDLVFGSTVSGRPAVLPEIESMIGCCINTLPLRVRIDPAAQLTEWLAELQAEHIAIREFEGSSLAAIQSWSGIAPGASLFESIVVFENYPVSFSSAGESNSLSISDLDVHEQSNFPLALLVIPDAERIRLILAYDGDRYAGDTTNRLLERLQAILEGMARNPDAILGNLDLVSAQERDTLSAWNHGPDLPGPLELLPTLIARHAADRATHPALVFEDKNLSWAELDQKSNAVAAALHHQGAAPGQCIALCIERSTEMILGIIGILKAGCSYVPLDPAYPAARRSFILDDCGINILLSRAGLHRDLPAATRLDFEDLPVTLEWDPGAVAVEANHLAYVIYTSGSTGRPKGVGVTHANLAASIGARRQHYLQPPERFLLLSSFSFDSSVAGIFWTLSSGGTLVLPRDREEQDMDEVAGLVSRHSITHTLCLPTLYALLLEYAPAQALQSLRVAIVAGEECPAAVVQAHHALLPGCELHNEYGPTEATVWCTGWKSNPAECPARVPIGKPIPGARVNLLDVHQRPVPIGVPGELWVGGAGVAPGYLHDPGQTDRQFVPDLSSPGPGRRLYRSGDFAVWLPDGNLLFLGRIDGQVKVRGHRIELGEIEATLAAHPAVFEVVATAAPPSMADDLNSLARALEDLPEDQINLLFAEIGP